LCKQHFAASGGEIKWYLGACFLIFFRKIKKQAPKQNTFLFKGSSMDLLRAPPQQIAHEYGGPIFPGDSG
jgi:hypothetical protein